MTRSGSVNFIFGEERFLVDEKVASLIQPEVFTDRFEGDVNLDEVIQAVQSTSLFSPQKQILVKSPQFLTQSASDSDLKNLAILLSEAAQSEHFLLIYHPGKLDQRKKAVAYLKKNVTTYDYVPFKDWEQEKVVQWIQNRVRGMQKSIELDAALALEQMLGPNLQKLSAELDKLSLYLGGGTTIRLSDIQAVSGGSEASAFLFSEAIKARNSAQLLMLGHHLLNSGEDPVKLLGLMAGNMRLIVQVLLMASSGTSAQDIAQTLGKNPFFIKQILAVVKKNYSVEYAIQKHQDLASADLAIKSGKLKPEAAIQIVLSKFCGKITTP